MANTSEHPGRGAASAPAEAPAEAAASDSLLHSLLAERPAVTSWERKTREGYVVELQGLGQGAPEQMRLVAPNGQLCLTIVLSPEGPRVEVAAASMSIRAQERLRLEAGRVEIVAHDALELSSGGTIHHKAAGLNTSEAHEHHIEATHGEIRLLANDDIALDGERIRLNSPTAPLPPHVRLNSPAAPPARRDAPEDE